MTDQPFISLVWSPNGVTGCLFDPEFAFEPISIDAVSVLGQGRFQFLQPRQRDVEADIDDRQRRALGALGNAFLRQLRVGLVGVGGTGSPLAEQFARMGVAEITLVDHDLLDTPSNLRRLVGSRARDLADRPQKASVVKRHLDDIGLGVEVHAVPADVRSERAARRLIDLDLVIVSTDNQSSRAFMNQLALQYWLPVVDVGLRVGTTQRGVISGMPTEVRVLMPDLGCLWCRGALDAEAIREEGLPLNERERLAAEGYIQGVPDPQPSLAPLNAFAASFAALTALRLVSSEPIVSPSAILDPWELYAQLTPAPIDPGCLCQRWRGRADAVAMPFLPQSEL